MQNIKPGLPSPGENSDQGVFLSPTGRIARCKIWGQTILFTVSMPQDAIQRTHAQGKFYEQEELEIIRSYMDPGAVFCDIGANVGNHTLFALKYLRASRAIVFEPNPDVIPTLVSNLTLNDVADSCDITWLGIGLSDEAASGLTILVKRERNLGGARIVSGDGAGKLQVVRGDDALADRRVDFIKLDVEGMELKVLKGLTQTITRFRPKIFVEVENRNHSEFRDWVGRYGYQVGASFRRYRSCENIMLTPMEQV